MNIETCSKCGKLAWLTYTYRGRVYCHECLRPIADVVHEQDERRIGRPSDYLFFPFADDETRLTMLSWVMADAMLRANIDRAFVYAWHVCGFFPPATVNRFRKMMGGKPIRTNLTKAEVKQWDDAVDDYRAWEAQSKSAPHQ